MSPKRPEHPKAELVAFRLDPEQTREIDALLARMVVPAALKLSRSELARLYLLEAAQGHAKGRKART